MKQILLQVLLVAGMVRSLWAQDARDDAQSVLFLADNAAVVLKFDIRIGIRTPRDLFDGYIDQMMSEMDVDRDGVVTVDEARGKYLTAREAQQSQLISPSAVMADSSPDISPADGKITRAEFVAYYRRLGFSPFQVVFQPNQTRPARPRQGRPDTNPVEVPLFVRLDLNGDSRLSIDELKGALKTLRKLDLDNDEMISAAELNSGVVANQFVVAATPPANQAVAAGPFLSLGSGEPITRQVRRLIDKYDSTVPLKSGVADATARNQKLSSQELGVLPDAFARYDGDGDGQLDFDELRQFLSSPEPTITIGINVETTDALTVTSPRPDMEEKLRTAADGTANINLGSTQLTVIRGPSSDAAGPEVLLKAQFMAADVDANGYLEKGETERAFLFGASFDDLDADRNGKVFLDELLAAFHLRFAAGRSRVVVSINEQGRTLFEILDTDRDRRLSFREVQAAADKLALWDKDQDGLLAESEIPLQYRLMIAQGNLPALNINVPLPNQGVNDSESMAGRPLGPLWFRKMDKNRDGEVSRREFLGEIAAFDLLDFNQDGFLDVTEALRTGEINQDVKTQE